METKAVLTAKNWKMDSMVRDLAARRLSKMAWCHKEMACLREEKILKYTRTVHIQALIFWMDTPGAGHVVAVLLSFLVYPIRRITTTRSYLEP